MPAGQAGVPHAACQDLAHQQVSSAGNSVKPVSPVSRSVRETWPTPSHIPLEELPRTFLALGSSESSWNGLWAEGPQPGWILIPVGG